MSKYNSGLIGLDAKPRRKITQRNRFKSQHPAWLLPVMIALVALVLLVVAITR